MTCVSKIFPKSYYHLLEMVGCDGRFTKHIVCTKCCKLYKHEDAVEKCGTTLKSKCCSHVLYPNHPQMSRRAPCNASLLKSVECTSGKKFLYPHKVYCYNSLISSLQNFLLRPKFLASCEQWRSKNVDTNSIMKDIFDGAIWYEFKRVREDAFLASPYALAFILNIDWFQPYSHTIYSVGAVYLTVMNLSRSVRYKRENIILLGIIPGPSEPEHDINNYLQPLVDELLKLWKGVRFMAYLPSGKKDEILIRCALLCVACDLPAGRKVCGFLCHSATLGCSRCLKEFPGPVGCKDYSGFNRSLWQPRTEKGHRDAVDNIKKCTTKSAKTSKESEKGCRYSILLDLPYFDPVRMLPVDPMHNLFLGTGKRMISIWIEHNLLSTKDFKIIQESVDDMTVPSDVGRIPLKIASGFSSFKADQFKNWINIYSIPALYDILPNEHLECWGSFVLACRILCKNTLSHGDIDLADALLLHFCKRVERLYGGDVITPNMHLHCHLKQVIKDYGPIQEIWLFFF